MTLTTEQINFFHKHQQMHDATVMPEAWDILYDGFSWVKAAEDYINVLIEEGLLIAVTEKSNIVYYYTAKGKDLKKLLSI